MDIWNLDAAFFHSIFCIWKEGSRGEFDIQCSTIHCQKDALRWRLKVDSSSLKANWKWLANTCWREYMGSSCATIETSQQRAGVLPTKFDLVFTCIYPLNWITKGRHYVQVNRQHLAWLKSYLKVDSLSSKAKWQSVGIRLLEGVQGQLLCHHGNLKTEDWYLPTK